MASPPYKPPKLGVNAQFRPDKFRSTIHVHGSTVRWEQAAKCPCMEFNSDEVDAPQPTGLPRSGCEECHGKGFLYHDPEEFKALVLAGSRIPLFYQIYGERARGMANITTFAEIVPHEWDRFTVLDSVIRMSEDRVREGATVERLRYPIMTRTLELGMSALAPTVRKEVESNGIYMRRATAAGVVAPTPSTEGVNFSIDDNGQLVWIAHANTPAVGERFSITYFASPAYIVQDVPHVHRDAYVSAKQIDPKRVSLPLQMHCWLEHLGPPHGYAAT